VLSGFSKSGSSCGDGASPRPGGVEPRHHPISISMSISKSKVRLWRRAQFCLGQSDFIFADGAWNVCEGDHSLDVMNPWDALTTCIEMSAMWSILWNVFHI